MYYTGIGSKDTPTEYLKLMFIVTLYLAKNNLTLRSGAALGADKAFELGCLQSNGRKEIYLPWKGFNGSISTFISPKDKAIEIAKSFHPHWDKLSHETKLLQARNSHRILGINLDSPSSFVICYTKGGKLVGGIAQAIRIANHYNIPVFNMGVYSDINLCRTKLLEFLEPLITFEVLN